MATGASLGGLRHAAPSGTIRITALGQAGFALLAGPSLLLVDPFLSPRPDRLWPPAVDPAELHSVDLVLATHEHADHLDLAAWSRIAAASPGAVFVVPEPIRGLVGGAGIPEGRIVGATLGPIAIDSPVGLTAVPACHATHMADGYSVGPDNGHPRFLGYVVDLDGVRVYHAGDTIPYPDQASLVRSVQPDVALLPVNGRDAAREARGIVGNLTPEEAADLARDLGVRLAIPMHHDLVAGNSGGAAAFVEASRANLDGPSVIVLTAADSVLVEPSATTSRGRNAVGSLSSAHPR